MDLSVIGYENIKKEFYTDTSNQAVIEVEIC